MAKVILRSNFASGSIPQASEIEISELVLGAVDGRLWTKTPGNQVLLLNPGGGGGGGSSISASYALTSSFAVSASWAPGGAGSIGGSGTTNKISKFTAGTTIGDSSLTDTGTIISSSVPISGSSFTGSFSGDGANITGVISSSFATTSSAATSITFVPASASYATTSSAATSITFIPVSASFAITASAATSLTFTASRSQLPPEIAYEDEANVFRANQIITGSLNISGNINATGYSITASEFKGGGSQITGIVSSSYATTSSAATSITFTPVSASYALTSSFAPRARKVGSVVNTSFAGNPRKATVTFGTAFPDTNYAVTITGEDSRAWSIESKVAGSFIINSNSNTALAGTTYWIAIAYGET